jgi:3-methylcrotonyl-CoA carboxylase alpha subunit
MFEKVLIADRGEVVFRIARTCERLGIAAAAIYSQGEVGAPHTTACDEARCVGPAGDAYADVDAVIAAAKEGEAQAVHPGYGRLSQDPNAARAVTAAGLIYIGPGADLLERLSDPARCREIALMAGVRALPTAIIESLELDAVRLLGSDVGYPLVVKTMGSGPASEVCDDEQALDEVLRRFLDAAPDARTNARVWLERSLHDPRVLAVQVVADSVEAVALGDLERSLRLIGESPAPALSAQSGRGPSHKTLCDAALRIAREAGLVGAGIAEFLLDSQGRLFFSHLRAGLPPEHALAEMCCNLDLVEIQLRLAAGERLPPEGRRAQPTGHAAEARVIATAENHVQSPAESITTLRWPVVAPGCLRVETELAVGHRPATDGDRLVAKIAAYGQTRHQALLTLDRVLAEATIEPIATNLDFLRSVLADESFRAGQYDSGFADRLRT